MSPLRLLSGLCLCLLTVCAVHAQDTYLRLDAPNTALVTGQDTVVTITGQNLPSLWVGDMTIRYDPSAVYIMGTVSGAPITAGADLSAQPFTLVRNAVNNETLQYTFSLINPAQPLSGTVTLGTFHIYPLKAGPTEIQFYSAELSSFTPRADGQAIQASDIVSVPFLPVLLHLDITGETVPPPSEATATPAPAPTEPLPDLMTLQPTADGLVNVTAPPLASATPEPAGQTAAAPTSPIVFIGGGLVIVALLGLAALVVVRRRR